VTGDRIGGDRVLAKPDTGWYARRVANLAGRRCPGCGAVQPVIIRRSAVKSLPRGPYHVVPCPGCGARVSLGSAGLNLPGIALGVIVTLMLTGLALLAWNLLRSAEAHVIWTGLALFLMAVGIVKSMEVFYTVADTRNRPCVLEDLPPDPGPDRP